jgi:hypothetical protein
MRKIPVFYVLIGLLLAVSVAAADVTPAKDLQFCFKEVSPTMEEFYQGSTGATGEKCFQKWYDEDNQGGNDAATGYFVDAYNYLDNYRASITLTSDIEFAGHTGESCNTGDNAFKGRGFGISEGSVFQTDGNVYTISGLCYAGPASVSFVYVPASYSTSPISNLIFDDVP